MCEDGPQHFEVSKHFTLHREHSKCHTETGAKRTSEINANKRFKKLKKKKQAVRDPLNSAFGRLCHSEWCKCAKPVEPSYPHTLWKSTFHASCNTLSHLLVVLLKESRKMPDNQVCNHSHNTEKKVIIFLDFCSLVHKIL